MTVQEWWNGVARRRTAAFTIAEKDNQRQAVQLCLEIGELAATARDELQPLGYEYHKAYKGLQRMELLAADWYAVMLVGSRTPARTIRALTNIHREAVEQAAICDSMPRDSITATPEERRPAADSAEWHLKRAKRLGAWCRDHGLNCADAKVMEIWMNGDECVECGEGCGIDHITPLKEGGMHCRDNLQAMCPVCNARKGASETESPSLPAITLEHQAPEVDCQPAYFALDRATSRIEVFDSQEEVDDFVAANRETRRPVKEETLLRKKTREEVDSYVAAERARRKSEMETPTLHIARQGNNLLSFANAEESAEWVADGANRHLVSEAALRAKAEQTGQDYDAIVADMEARRAQRESNRRAGGVADGPPLRLTPAVGAASRRPTRMGRRARLRRQGMRSFQGRREEW